MSKLTKKTVVNFDELQSKTMLSLDELRNKKGVESIKVLNEIDFLISNASTVPLTSKVMVDAEYLFSLIEKFRQVFPVELEQADMIVAEIQEIADAAEKEAEKIITEAHKKADSLLNDSRLLKEAQYRANILVDEAISLRNQMQREAEDYVYNLFREAESKLMDNATSVKNAIASIKQPVAKKQR